MIKGKLIKLLAIASMGVFLMACVTPNSPTQLTVAGFAKKNANRGLPTAVRVYALSSDHLFYGYDFFSLTLDAEAVLGVTLKGVLDEMYLEPGETAVYGPYDVPKNTRMIGVVAAFQNIEGARWRDTIAVVDRGTYQKVYIAIDGNKVSLMSKSEYDKALAASQEALAAAEKAAKEKAAAAKKAAEKAAKDKAAAEAAKKAAAEKAAKEKAAAAKKAAAEKAAAEKKAAEEKAAAEKAAKKAAEKAAKEKAAAEKKAAEEKAAAEKDAA